MAISNLQNIGLILFSIFSLMILIGSILINKKAKSNGKALGRKDIYTSSMGIFFLLIAIGLIIRIYFMFFIAKTPEEFVLQMTAIERSAEALPDYASDGRLELLQILWQVHVAITTAGLAALMYGTEYQILKKTKFTLTIFELITAPLILIFPYEIAHNIYYVSFFPPLVWIILYSLMAKQTTGSIRTNAIMFLIGFLIFFAGSILTSGTARSVFFGYENYHISEVTVLYSSCISPLIMALGFLFMFLGILNKFAKTKT